MRANFLQPSLAHTKLVDDDSLHSMPVAQMGNYQEYLKRMTPQLREIESTPVRQHMFGNPFKIDKVCKANFILSVYLSRVYLTATFMILNDCFNNAH